jgi:UDP-N-acetylglucosamine:LPS N-acetylglucosamine transferase
MLRSDTVASKRTLPIPASGLRSQQRFKNLDGDILNICSDAAKVLVVASKGGHWDQAMALRDVFAPYRIAYATTDRNLIASNAIEKAFTLPDCNRHTPLRILWAIVFSFWIVLRFRPDYVISTGALPGLFCILFGRLLGAETIWLDSVANAERLSMCGQVATRIATLTLTQWKHLARAEGPRYAGSVL